jgi:hypothetical protein
LPAPHVVERVKFLLLGIGLDPDSPKRQHAYLSALKSCPRLRVFNGRLLAKTIWRGFTNFSVAGARMVVSLPAGNHNVKGGIDPLLTLNWKDFLERAPRKRSASAA